MSSRSWTGTTRLGLENCIISLDEDERLWDRIHLRVLQGIFCWKRRKVSNIVTNVFRLGEAIFEGIDVGASTTADLTDSDYTVSVKAPLEVARDRTDAVKGRVEELFVLQVWRKLLNELASF